MRRLLIPMVIGLAWLILAPSAMAQATETPTPTSTPVPTATPSVVPISTDLISCWTFDETGGVRFDSYGSNHLTDNNTVMFETGKWNYAALFVAANSEKLTIADNDSLSFGDHDFTIGGWWKPSADADQYILDKYNSTGNNREYILSYITSTHNLSFYLVADGVTGVTVLNPLTVSVGSFYFILVWYDHNTDTVFIQVNNAQTYSQSESGGGFNGTAGFNIGGRTGQYVGGSLDEWFVYHRALPLSTRTWLYNSGYGRPCSELTVAATPTPVPLPEYNINLSSGDFAVLERRIDYGQIAIVVAVGFLILVMSLSNIMEIIEKWLS